MILSVIGHQLCPPKLAKICAVGSAGGSLVIRKTNRKSLRHPMRALGCAEESARGAFAIRKTVDGLQTKENRQYGTIHCFLLVAVFITLLTPPVQAQVLGEAQDESRLYAESKQVNQFFRRFNGEEDEKGNRYYPGDKQYRSDKLRRQYLRMLFDESNADISSTLKTTFLKDVLEKADASILNFHGGNWFSELHTTFTMNGVNQRVILFMELEKHRLGTRWVIQKVHADMFEPYFRVDTIKVGRFLHPMSHELDFMNLRKAFDKKDSINQFIVKRFVPDHLSVFLYEVKRGNLKFKTVNEVKFHFFQIDGWYFGISEFNRPGYNTGWLISNLVRVNNPSDKDLLRKFLYYEAQ